MELLQIRKQYTVPASIWKRNVLRFSRMQYILVLRIWTKLKINQPKFDWIIHHKNLQNHKFSSFKSTFSFEFSRETNRNSGRGRGGAVPRERETRERHLVVGRERWPCAWELQERGCYRPSRWLRQWTGAPTSFWGCILRRWRDRLCF